MGTLRKVKRKMRMDKDFRKTLVRSAKDEILIDLDGDGQPDVALMDSIGDGDIDTLAVDLNGDGEFNLYFHDSDGNGLPDLVMLDSEGDGTVEVLGFGPEVETRMIMAGHAILAMLDLGDYVTESLDSALDNLQKEIEEARKLL
ncbi:MAG: hypothetical protein Q4F41_09125 [Eubacteriales bacterium]|nr:hypothetical protein [Eubacteriales bacterium]